MLRTILNFKIGTKLAIASLLSLLLVGAVFYAQLSGNAAVQAANDDAIRLQTVLHNIIDAKASVRGMQIGVRDMRLATSIDALQKANEYLSGRQRSAANFADEAEKLTRNPQQAQRIQRYKALVADYATNAQSILALKSDAINLRAGRASGAMSEIDAAKIVRIDDEAIRIAREFTLPIASELEDLVEKIVQHAKSRASEQVSIAAQEMTTSQRNGMIAGALAALLLLGTCIFSVMTIARPMTALTIAMKDLANGNFNVVLPGLGRKDEVGGVAEAVEGFKVKAVEKARDEANAKSLQDQIVAQQRRQDMAKLANDFDRAVGEIVNTVSSASTELEASASTLTSTAEHAQHLATMLAAASEEATTNVQSVAGATEELSASVGEISRQVQESARMAGDAVDQARKTMDQISQLSEASSRIGDVVSLISNIAGQTNLLALNATIEAARAGDAGRGFAVVASEVKALAEQTAKATGEIAQQVQGIQNATQESVTAIGQIGTTIQSLSEISSSIAAAIEEQGAATQEIARNIQQAAQGTQQVSSNITDVQRGAVETGGASSQVLASAQMLSSDSTRLQTEVHKFLETVRAA